MMNKHNASPASKHSLPPPNTNAGMTEWLRKRMFSSPLNIMLTLLSLALLTWIIPPLINWAFITASWGGDSAALCEVDGVGACWTFINVKLRQFVFGFYPQAEQWRVELLFVVFFTLIAYLVIPKTPKKGWLGLFALLGFPIIAFILLRGGLFGLETVSTSYWGGLSLTLVISFVSIVGSLPLGILLALGRRSNMPATRAACVIFIELWRSVPLITVLFMASVMFPLFLPDGVNFDKLLKALLGITLFTSAYMAEVIRGGLQAIPKGQIEAAQSLGLGYWKTMGLIILPQALKTVIPGIVNTFIGTFKDTTLVLIIGLFDFLGVIQAASQDAEWLGYHTEGYVFAAFIYFCFCFSMSRYSIYLERKLHTGH